MFLISFGETSLLYELGNNSPNIVILISVSSVLVIVVEEILTLTPSVPKKLLSVPFVNPLLSANALLITYAISKLVFLNALSEISVTPSGMLMEVKADAP